MKSKLNGITAVFFVVVMMLIFAGFVSPIGEALASSEAGKFIAKQEWKVLVADNLPFYADTGDVDGDEIDDVAIIPADWHRYSEGTNNTLQVIKSDGTELWSKSILIEMTQGGGVGIADIDGDNKGEVFVFGSNCDINVKSDALIYCFDDDGTPLWVYQDKDDYGYYAVIASRFVFANIDADPEPEIIIGNGAYKNRFTYALDGDGSLIWRFDGNQVTDLIIGDVTGDRIEEIIVGTVLDKKVRILDKDGNLLWQHATNWHDSRYYGQTAALGDLTGDGINDIVIISGTGEYLANVLYVLRNDGKFLWNKEYSTTRADTPTRPIVMDIDGDEISDVIVMAEKKIYAYKGEGSLLWESERFFDGPTNLYLFDINRDGKKEIIFQKDHTIYQIRLDGIITLVGLLANEGECLRAGRYNGMVVAGDVNNDGFDELIVREVIDEKTYIATIKVIAPESEPTPTPTPEPKEPLKLIKDTLELTEGDSTSYTVKSNGGSLIVKANGLNEMFLIKNQYTIEILKDGEPFETYNEEFSTLEPVGDPAKVEIVLPPEPAQYTVTVTCDNIGNFLLWSNGEKAQIVVFSSLHTTESAKAVSHSYRVLTDTWDAPFTEAFVEVIKQIADPTTFKGMIKLFLPETASELVSAINLIRSDNEQIVEKLVNAADWASMASSFREGNTYDFGEMPDLRDELREFYEKVGFNCEWPPRPFMSPDLITTQLRAMSHLNWETYQALKDERFDDARFYMEAQYEFLPHLSWIYDAEHVKLPPGPSQARSSKNDPYHEIWALTEAFVKCDADRIKNYFSERTPPQQTGCGNGICEMSEDCNSCPEDCGCPAGEYCSKIGICMPVTCGDEVCSPGEEDTCCEDCGCPEDKICNKFTQTCQEKAAISDERVMEIVNDYMNKNNIDGTITISDVYYKYETVKQVNINCETYGIVLFINDRGKIVEEFRTT